MEAFEKKISERLRELVDEKSSACTFLLAVSGGSDSMALAHAMKACGFSIEIAHINYNIRPESKKEFEGVRTFAQKHNIPFHFREISEKPREESTQKWARKIRYDFFTELMDTRDIDYCLIAHQSDDQVESVIKSIIAGDKDVTLKGIPGQRQRILRPMLEIPKSEILAYAKASNLEYFNDSSNSNNDYQRNRIRNKVLPEISNINESYRNTLLEKLHGYGIQRQIIEKIGKKYSVSRSDQFRLNWNELKKDWKDDQARIIAKFALLKRGLAGGTLKEAMKIMEGKSGASMTRGNLAVYNDHGTLFIKHKEELSPELSSDSPQIVRKEDLPFAGSLQNMEIRMEIVPAGEFNTLNKNTGFEQHFLSTENIQFPLRLRPWKKGDRMKPFGLEGYKKISDIFIDQKRSLWEKEKAVVFEDSGDEIILLSGYRLSGIAAIEAGEKEILKVEIEYA